MLKPGLTAPEFTLPDQAKANWTLSDHVRTGDVVLCFFPFAFTGVCSVEMRCISDEMAKWAAKGATVVGVSCDSMFANKAWADSSSATPIKMVSARSSGIPAWSRLDSCWVSRMIVCLDNVRRLLNHG